MKSLLATWQFWALLSAIFAKVGIANINADFGTFIRTMVIVGIVAVILTAGGGWQSLATIPAKT